MEHDAFLGRADSEADTTPLIEALTAAPEQEIAPGVVARELLRVHTRPATPPGATYHAGVEYGHVADGSLTLRLYARADHNERAPAVVFIHGGGWVAGDPYMHIRHANALAAMGYVTAMISYRQPPRSGWPAPVQDAKCAVRWLRANAARVGADPDRIAVAGGSAGGQLAALVALTPGLWEDSGGHEGVSSAVQAAVLWYPATDLTRIGVRPEHREAVEAFFGSPIAAVAAEASPIHMVHGGAPPTLLLTGSADQAAPLAMIQDYERAVRDAGVPVEMHVFDGRNHAFDLLPVDWDAGFAPVVPFLDRHLGPVAAAPLDAAATASYSEGLL